MMDYENRDFADEYAEVGADAVCAALARAEPIGNDSWPAPLPLSNAGEAEPYPLDALPPLLGSAVREVQAYVQAPLALVATSALGALSVAGQGLADVARDDRLWGPVSLYTLALAESGERKSTCDGYFVRPIVEWERDEAERLGSRAETAERERAIWAAKRGGLLETIKRKSKAADANTGDLEAALEHLGPEPERVRVPMLRHNDGGPEALGWALATEWPSAAVLSAEGGAVLGSHGMNAETIMRNLALWNVLWDGGTHIVRRRTSASFTVRGARLTVGLMVQPATLREFLAKSGPLARGSGFLARFLVAVPSSTQGLRPYVAPPSAWPALDRLNGRVRELLDFPLPWDGAGLAPPRLMLDAAAKAEWVRAHNAVEAELRDGGECADVRDVASKTLDNAARLAGLFHLFEHGPVGAIGEANAVRGINLAVWHLWEARRLWNGAAPPPRVGYAEQLEEWLAEAGKGCPVNKRHAMQSAPGAVRNSTRNGPRFDNALALLMEKGRARVLPQAGGTTIALNPALFGTAP